MQIATGSGQKKSVIRTRADDLTAIPGQRTVARRLSSSGGMVRVVRGRVRCNRTHDLQPPQLMIDLVDGGKCLIDVRQRGDERRAGGDSSIYRDPIERISPPVT